MTYRSLLVCLCFMVFLLGGCSFSSVSTTQEQSNSQPQPRAENHVKPKAIDNTESFWDNKPEPFVSLNLPDKLTAEEIQDTYKEAVRQEQIWIEFFRSNKKANSQGYKALDEAIRGYARVAAVDPTALPDLIGVLGSGIMQKSDLHYLTEVVVVMDAKYPNTPGLKTRLRDLQTEYYEMLKEAHFDSNSRYGPERFKNMDDIIMLSGSTHFLGLMKIEKALGYGHYKQIQMHYADYWMGSYTHDGATRGPYPLRSYQAYMELGMKEDAQKAALMAADEMLQAYLNGVINPAGSRPIRNAFLPYDLSLAKQWYERAGLPKDQMQQRIKLHATNAAQQSEASCEGLKQSWQCKAAQQQYETAGDNINARRMELRSS